VTGFGPGRASSGCDFAVFLAGLGPLQRVQLRRRAPAYDAGPPYPLRTSACRD